MSLRVLLQRIFVRGGGGGCLTKCGIFLPHQGGSPYLKTANNDVGKIFQSDSKRVRMIYT